MDVVNLSSLFLFYMLTYESYLYLYDLLRSLIVVAGGMVTFARHHNIQAQDYCWDSGICYGGILRPLVSEVA